MGGGTVNPLLFEERGGKAALTCTALYKSREGRDSALRTDMEKGAAESHDRLAEELLRSLA